ncbi:YbhB/YbcL family Raf kinase inhibitor-like protein [Nocardia sp. NPDC020380]|uniref:YbhB/YbcL family Raf kinase inhibitor-like protein n=1 Tax=Nocardia sp. NPDC020380 TaxID=3364309 RepID=UPI0037A0B917
MIVLRREFARDRRTTAPKPRTTALRLGGVVLAAVAGLGLGAGAANATPPESLSVSSTAMPDGSAITNDQVAQLCGGRDLSPDLSWSGAPAETRSYAVVMSDPDAIGGTVWHWAAFDIPAGTTSLPTGLPSHSPLAKQADGQYALGYMGPCAPPGRPHIYHVVVYALDVPSLGLPDGVDSVTARAAIDQHALATGEIAAHYALLSRG